MLPGGCLVQGFYNPPGRGGSAKLAAEPIGDRQQQLPVPPVKHPQRVLIGFVFRYRSMGIHHRLPNQARDRQGIIEIRTAHHDRRTGSRSRRQTGHIVTSIPSFPGDVAASRHYEIPVQSVSA